MKKLQAAVGFHSPYDFDQLMSIKKVTNSIPHLTVNALPIQQ
jgi:hypothetical protein